MMEEQHSGFMITMTFDGLVTKYVVTTKLTQHWLLQRWLPRHPPGGQRQLAVGPHELEEGEGDHGKGEVDAGVVHDELQHTLDECCTGVHALLSRERDGGHIQGGRERS